MNPFRSRAGWLAVAVLASAGLAFGQAEQQRSERAAAPTYTNADLDKLPVPGNDRLPALEEEQAAPAPAVPAEVAPTPADLEAAKWLEQELGRLQIDNAIQAARRRLAEATASIERLTGAERPAASAWGETAEDRLVRGVADARKPADVELQRAQAERAAAQAELQRLLAGSGS